MNPDGGKQDYRHEEERRREEHQRKDKEMQRGQLNGREDLLLDSIPALPSVIDCSHCTKANQLKPVLVINRSCGIKELAIEALLTVTEHKKGREQIKVSLKRRSVGDW